MAKLSTKTHPCAQSYVGGKCPRPAYRRHNGEWMCRPCTGRLRAAEARVDAEIAARPAGGTPARQRDPRPMFEVVGSGYVDLTKLGPAR